MMKGRKKSNSDVSFFSRTDLACEGRVPHSPGKPGYSVEETESRGIKVTRMQITGKRAAEEIGRPIGTYITIFCGKIWELGQGEEENTVAAISGELRRMAEKLMKKPLSSDTTVLVCGLGNEEITADAVGPSALSKLTVTLHMRELDPGIFRSLGHCGVCALKPGVLAQTGIETSELICGAVKRINPDLVIVIDALAARSCKRLAATVQLSDTGIEPGSGIGNTRRAIDRNSLGVPVIAIGVPTVIDSSSLVFDALTEAGIEEISSELCDVLRNGRNFFVSLKESDIITRRVAALLSDGVNAALTLSDQEGF